MTQSRFNETILSLYSQGILSRVRQVASAFSGERGGGGGGGGGGEEALLFLDERGSCSRMGAEMHRDAQLRMAVASLLWGATAVTYRGEMCAYTSRHGHIHDTYIYPCT